MFINQINERDITILDLDSGDIGAYALYINGAIACIFDSLEEATDSLNFLKQGVI